MNLYFLLIYDVTIGEKMKKILFCLSIFCSFVFAFAQDTEEEEKIKIGFANFENKAIAIQKAKYHHENRYTEIKLFNLDVFIDMLQTALVKTRRFDVIERTRLDAILEEQGLGIDGIIDKEQAAVSGKISGIDFILMGTITKCGFTEKPIRIKNFEQIQKIIEFTVDFRLTDVHTGQVVLADFVEVNDVSSVLTKGNSYQSETINENFIVNVMRKASLQSAFLIANAIVPVQVSAVSGTKVKINYGNGFVETKQVYKIFPSDEFEDNLNIGFDEIARIKIRTVSSDFAIGEIINGSADDVAVGYSCLKATPSEEKEYEDIEKSEKNKSLRRRFGY